MAMKMTELAIVKQEYTEPNFPDEIVVEGRGFTQRYVRIESSA
jgi:hypothetical protein